MPGSFFDTNVLLYTASGEATKADRAEQLILAGGVISVQVLNEIANVAQRKMHYSWERTQRLLFRLQAVLAVVPVTIDTHRRGIFLAERYGLSIYDAMIAAAAIDSGCDQLWSEDMHHGLVLDGRLTIANPFSAA
jgi:predicted nucleic acid-binding protein